MDSRGASAVRQLERGALCMAAFFAIAMAGCGSPGGQECDSDADCPPAFECVSSGGVVFGQSICLQTTERADVGSELDAGPDLDARADANASDVATDAHPDADVCRALVAEEICQRDGKNCGTYTADNGCGQQVDVQCGLCETPEVCGGGDADDNVCRCPAVDPAEFCLRHNKDCGAFDADNACGEQITVSCGSCEGDDCGSTTPNVCGCPCQIDGECIPEGGRNPAQPCEACVPDQDSQNWSLLPKDTPCDDGDACTYDTSCRPSGQCQGRTVDCSHLDGVCEEGVCDGGNCVAEILEGSTCDDGDYCTVDSVCLADGTCSGDPRLCPDHSEQCMANVCTSSASACQEQPTVGAACDDGLACTSGSTCDAGGDCPVGAIDVDSCLIGDVCVTDGASNPYNPCQFCDASVDQSDWSQRPDGVTCDSADGLSCTGLCSAGTCLDEVHDGYCAVDGGCYGDGDANPDNSCEVCDVTVDQSSWSSDAGAICDDGLACTDSGSCDADGVCQSGSVQTGACLIDGSCYSQGDSNPVNSCQYCEPSQSQVDWSDRSSGTQCSMSGSYCLCSNNGQCVDLAGNACL